jgi:hypothetical protein
LVALHAKFIHDHRRIQILQVPHTQFTTVTNRDGSTLRDILFNTPHIYRIEHDTDKSRLSLSVPESQMVPIRQVLDSALSQFPYRPYRYSSTDTIQDTETAPSFDRYEHHLAKESINSQDMSTIQSTKRFTGWNRPPPPEIIVQYDASFPHLPKPASPDTPDTHTTANTTQITDQFTKALEEQDEKWTQRIEHIMTTHRQTVDSMNAQHQTLMTMQQQQQQTIQQLLTLFTSYQSPNPSSASAVSNPTSTTQDPPVPSTLPSKPVLHSDIAPIYQALARITDTLSRLEAKRSPLAPSSPPLTRKRIANNTTPPHIAHLRDVSCTLDTTFAGTTPSTSPLPDTMELGEDAQI